MLSGSILCLVRWLSLITIANMLGSALSSSCSVSFLIVAITSLNLKNFKHQQLAYSPTIFLYLLQSSTPSHPKIAVCPVSKVQSMPLTARNVGMHQLFYRKPSFLLNNNINLLGEKLARQHEQEKRQNISVKQQRTHLLQPTNIPLGKHRIYYYVSLLYHNYFHGQVNASRIAEKLTKCTGTGQRNIEMYA